MQLTRFDRWLRAKFVYVTQIQTLSYPENIPPGIRFMEQPDPPGKRYKHLFIASSEKAANQFIDQLKENSQMYTTQVVDKDAWYVPFIAPKDKSLTWWMFSTTLFAIAAFFILLYLKGLVQDPEFRANFAEAIEIMKG